MGLRGKKGGESRPELQEEGKVGGKRQKGKQAMGGERQEGRRTDRPMEEEKLGRQSSTDLSQRCQVPCDMGGALVACK